MLDKADKSKKSGQTNRRRPAARFPGTSAQAGSARPGHPHRPRHRQGQRTAPAGALAVPGRAGRGTAPRLSVHQRGRRLRAALRHSGRGRRARRLAGNLRRRHGQAGRRHRRSLDACRGASNCAGRRHLSRVPGSHYQRRRSAEARRRPCPPAGANLDARLRLRALPHRDFVHHARSGNRSAEHGHLSRRVESTGPARRAHVVASGRRRRLSALAQIPETQGTNALRHRDRLRAGRAVYWPAKARHRFG